MPETVIRFGTDGWRAIMATEYTVENVRRVTQAFCVQSKETGASEGSKIIVGFDRRQNSEIFAETVTKILIANGLKPVLSDRPCPTPAVSRAVIDQKAFAGIIITASHNPGEYNGFKIKDAQGASAPQTTTQRIEELIDDRPVLENTDTALDAYISDIVTPYLQSVREYLNMDLFNTSSMKVVVDSMHGIGADYVAQILKDTPIQVTTLRSERDFTFGGNAPEPIAKNLKPLIDAMKTGQYDAGFATDGDADRIGIVRKGGEFVSPGTLLAMIMMHFAEDLGWSGDVVKTLSNTSLITAVAADLGLKLHETPVGFKYIVDIMKNTDVLIAGEESGGIAYKNYMFERDGILSALLMMQMMAKRKLSMDDILEEFERKYGKFLYQRTDVRVQDSVKDKIMSSLSDIMPEELCGIKVDAKNTMDGVKFLLEDGSWLLFRMSGTEPLLRVYAESKTPGMAESLNKWGINFAESVN